MNGQKITGIANGSNAQDAVSFTQMNSSISTAISGSSAVITGSIIMWGNLVIPTGYLECNG